MPLKRARTARSSSNSAPTESPALSAFDRSLRLLEHRPHFRRELELKLARAGHEGDEIAAAVERLAELGYLDDERAAKNHAAALGGRKGYGASRIRAELARRGAPAGAIATALAANDAESELARARETAAKWRRKGGARSADATGSEDSAALARHLDRRGFDRRVIFTVLKELSRGGEGEPFADE